MMKSRPLAPFSLSALALVACTHSVAGGRGDGVNESAIVGGDPVSSSDPIAAMTVSVLDPSPDVGQFCSGIVLGRDVVLSAAHCFDKDEGTRTPHVRLGAQGNPIIKARLVAVHEGYSEARRKQYDGTIASVSSPDQVTTPDAPLSDLALLLLESPLPAAATPVSFAARSPARSTASLLTAGFGCTSTACDGPGDVLLSVPMTFVREAPAANLVVLSAGAKRGSCNGDSGGPDVVVGAAGPEVFAMVSTGPDACEAGVSVDTLLAPYRSWIDASTTALRAGRKSSGYRLLRF